MDDVLQRLQHWYAGNCDGDWEHGFGIRIETLDNPGWSVTINLEGTELEGRPFDAVKHGLGSEETADWHHLWVEANQFNGVGDPSKLGFILRAFLAWAEPPGA